MAVPRCLFRIRSAGYPVQTGWSCFRTHSSLLSLGGNRGFASKTTLPQDLARKEWVDSPEDEAKLEEYERNAVWANSMDIKDLVQDVPDDQWRPGMTIMHEKNAPFRRNFGQWFSERLSVDVLIEIFLRDGYF